MSIVFLTWELGGGQGHLTKIVPIIQQLRQRGHRVLVALKDLSRADREFGGLDVEYLQAPVKTRPAQSIYAPRSFAHILQGKGFTDRGELWAMASAWRNLLQLVKPDLIIFEHSPTALLAVRGLEIKKAVLGTGFSCPEVETGTELV